MSLEGRELGLLRLVEEQRDAACRRILAEAEQSARDILRQTHRKERAHLHRRVLEERARIHARIQAVEAERVTRERREQARSSAGILETGVAPAAARSAAALGDRRGPSSLGRAVSAGGAGLSAGGRMDASAHPWLAQKRQMADFQTDQLGRLRRRRK